MIRITFIFSIFVLLFGISAQGDNALQAQQLFEKSLKLIENPGGVQMDYELRITRLFTQTGKATLKGDKTLTETKNGKVWFNGKMGWWLDLKNNEVDLFDHTYKKHISLSKQLETIKTNCIFSLEKSDDSHYFVRLKVKKGAADIRECTALIDKQTYAPTQLRFKWKIFWFTVNLSNVKTGNFPDNIFTFNEKDYPNVKIVDKRKGAKK